VLFSLAAVAFLWMKPVIRPRWALPVLAVVAAMLVATLFALQPGRSLGEASNYFTAFFAFFLFSELIRRRLPAELVIKALLIVGAMLMLWGWMPAVAWYADWLATHPGAWFPDVTFRLPVPNMMAVLINIMTLLGLARLLFSNHWGTRILLALFCLSGFGLIYLSSSRGGWVGTAAGLTCLALLSYRYQRQGWLSAWHWIRSRKVLGVFLLLVALLVMVAGGWLLYKQATHSTHPAFFSARGYLWRPAWQAFLDHPITGIGLGGYLNYYFQFHSSPPSHFFAHAHNIYLDMLHSSGLLGLTAFAWLVVSLARKMYQRMQQVFDGMERSVFAGAAAALAAFLAHGFFDAVNFPSSVVWILMAALAAALTSPSAAAAPTAPLQKWSSGGIQALAVGVAVLAWFSIWQLAPVRAPSTPFIAATWQVGQP
jgi:O-antigen ligase